MGTIFTRFAYLTPTSMKRNRKAVAHVAKRSGRSACDNYYTQYRVSQRKNGVVLLLIYVDTS